MKIHISRPLFAWECLEDSPTIKTIRQLLEAVPDQDPIASLEAAQGKGRDDHPIRTLWGVVVLAVGLRHPTFKHCPSELRRNQSLRKLIGIESEERVPRKWNVSGLLDTLGQTPHRDSLYGIFDAMPCSSQPR